MITIPQHPSREQPGTTLPLPLPDPASGTATAAPPAAPLRWTSYGVTDIGKVRTLNEDGFLCLNQAGTWAVADGMGGHLGGDVASRMVTEVLRSLPSGLNLNSLLDECEKRLGQAHAYLRRFAREHDRRMAGTTVVALLLREKYGAFLWAGDSRLYRFREGKLYQLTTDHSQVSQYVMDGLLSPDEARAHPFRNRITRAVGAPEGLALDLDLTELQAGDRYLLCSDGLTGCVSDAEILDLLGARAPARPTCEKLLEQALHGGGGDNITVLVIDLHPGEGSGPRAPAPCEQEQNKRG